MDKLIAREIIECLPRGRTLFPYFRDRYAFALLAHAAGEGISVAKLKRGSFGSLLAKPRVKEYLGLLGTSRLCRKHFEQAWFEPAKTFLLTLGAWDGSHPRYDQVSVSTWYYG